jgi:hypothetical protein
MIALDDQRWQAYKGGYGTAYDVSVPLRRLFEQGPSREIWEELWNELHHQGDVGSASYAAVPWLSELVRRSPHLDWDPLALIATIELARPRNPEVPDELKKDYFEAICSLPAILGSHPDQRWSEDVMRAAASCVALARSQRWLGRAYLELDRDTAGRWFSEEFGWSIGDN